MAETLIVRKNRPDMRAFHFETVDGDFVSVTIFAMPDEDVKKCNPKCGFGMDKDRHTAIEKSVEHLLSKEPDISHLENVIFVNFKDKWKDLNI